MKPFLYCFILKPSLYPSLTSAASCKKHQQHVHDSVLRFASVAPVHLQRHHQGQKKKNQTQPCRFKSHLVPFSLRPLSNDIIECQGLFLQRLPLKLLGSVRSQVQCRGEIDEWDVSKSEDRWTAVRCCGSLNTDEGQTQAWLASGPHPHPPPPLHPAVSLSLASLRLAASGTFAKQ